MTVKEIVKAVSEGDLTPVEVYEDYYMGWTEERREHLMNSLMAVIVAERREGRWGGSADRNCSNCYGYLQRRWQDDMVEEEQVTSEPDSASKSLKTPALDQLFLNTKKGLKEKFIAFFSVPKREGIELDATNVVLLLKMIVGNDLKDCLSDNKMELRILWDDLRRLKLVRENVSNSTLDKARRNPGKPKPKILDFWYRFFGE